MSDDYEDDDLIPCSWCGGEGFDGARDHHRQGKGPMTSQVVW